MLGVFTAPGQGVADQLLLDVAAELQAMNIRLAGAVQCNIDQEGLTRCDMLLRLLDSGEKIGISQRLGSGSTGCRLDPEGLERTVGLVEASLEHRPDLLIVNKFGKQEVSGRGFRPAIGTALAADIPVLVVVNANYLEAFHGFSSEIAVTLSPEKSTILRWCLDAVRAT